MHMNGTYKFISPPSSYIIPSMFQLFCSFLLEQTLLLQLPFSVSFPVHCSTFVVAYSHQDDLGTGSPIVILVYPFCEIMPASPNPCGELVLAELQFLYSLTHNLYGNDLFPEKLLAFVSRDNIQHKKMLALDYNYNIMLNEVLEV